MKMEALGTKVYFWWRRVTFVVDRPHNNIILFIKLNIPVYHD